MHLRKIMFKVEQYPSRDCYPFNLQNFQKTESLRLNTPVTFFIGENGTGKSTLLKAIARRCDIHIWEPAGGLRFVVNPQDRKSVV